jgi:hypothetical protein
MNDGNKGFSLPTQSFEFSGFDDTKSAVEEVPDSAVFASTSRRGDEAQTVVATASTQQSDQTVYASTTRRGQGEPQQQQQQQQKTVSFADSGTTNKVYAKSRRRGRDDGA